MIGHLRNLPALMIAVALMSVGLIGQGQAAENSLAELRAQSIQSAVAKVAPAVVQLQPLGGADPLAGSSLSARSVSSPTTGLLISGEGEILTSSYSLDPAPASLVVTYADGSRSSAKLLAIDHNRSLALVQASRPPKTAPPELQWANSPRVGETAIAVGRTYRADQPNLAVGIVSALNRLYGRAVQTDAAASPANYGGPLVDLQGQVIGILTPLSAEGQGAQAGVGWYDSGIGFAVPYAQFKDRLETLRQRVALHRGRAGIAFASGNPHIGPAKLITVHPGGPADRAGLKAGDLIKSVNGRKVDSPKAYRFAAETLDAGQSVQIEALRGAKTITAQITLAKELKAYRHPYLGVIAARTDATANDEVELERTPGVELLHVFRDGPANKAGVEGGDRLVAINDQPTNGRGVALERLAAIAPGETVELGISRQGKPRKVSVTTAPLSMAPDPLSPSEGKSTETPLVVPGSPRKCRLLTPRDLDGKLPTLVWVGGEIDDGGQDLARLIASRGVIVAIIEPPEKEATRQSQQTYLQDLLGLLSARNDIDANRLAIGGAGRQAPLTLAMALSMRDRLSGVVLRNWPRPAPRAKANEPAHRLGVLQLSWQSRDQALSTHLEKLGYPTNHTDLKQPAQVAAFLANWLSGLDRF